MGIQPNLIAALVRSDKERQMTEPQILAGSGSFPDKRLTFTALRSVARTPSTHALEAVWQPLTVYSGFILGATFAALTLH
jgi:hypothetical protein